MPKHEETCLPTTLVDRLENAIEAYDEARQNTVSHLATLESAILAFKARKVYGVRRWSDGVRDARMFVIRSILEGRSKRHPTHEDFLETFPEDKDGELYHNIVVENSQQREKKAKFDHDHGDKDKDELRAIVPWFFEPSKD